MLQSKKPKSSHGVRHAYAFCCVEMFTRLKYATDPLNKYVIKIAVLQLEPKTVTYTTALFITIISHVSTNQSCFMQFAFHRFNHFRNNDTFGFIKSMHE